MPSCVLTFTHYLLSLKVIFDLGIMFYAVFTIFYFRLFSQSKYFTWGILQSRKPKRRDHHGIPFTLWVWWDEIDSVYFIFFYFDLFPRVFLTNLAIPYILVINNAFKYPNRIACVWLVFFKLKNQQNKMILQNNIRLFLYFFSISMLFDLSPFHRIILN